MSPSFYINKRMIPIFSASKVKTLDAQEIELEGITSFQLMQRASSALYNKLTELLAKTETSTVVILASGGNNGGDALCVGDLLYCNRRDGFQTRPQKHLDIVVFYIKISDRQTDDFAQAYANVKNII